MLLIDQLVRSRQRVLLRILDKAHMCDYFRRGSLGFTPPPKKKKEKKEKNRNRGVKCIFVSKREWRKMLTCRYNLSKANSQ